MTDRRALDSPEMGVEILSVLHRMYPKQFDVEKTLRLVGSRSTVDAIARGDDPRAIAEGGSRGLRSMLRRGRCF